jgi:cytochrome c oxidase assembly protein subunit 11
MIANPETTANANKRLVRRLVLLTVGMFAFGFLLIPFYDVLCKITGLNGKTGGRVEVVEAVKVDESRTVTVEFVASLNIGAPWEFAPKVARMQVHPGQFYQTHFWAQEFGRPTHDRSGHPQCFARVGSLAFSKDRMLLFQSPALSGQRRQGNAGYVPHRSEVCRLTCVPSLCPILSFRIDNAGS